MTVNAKNIIESHAVVAHFFQTYLFNRNVVILCISLTLLANFWKKNIPNPFYYYIKSTFLLIIFTLILSVFHIHKNKSSSSSLLLQTVDMPMGLKISRIASLRGSNEDNVSDAEGPNTIDEARDYVAKLVDTHPVVIFSSTYCPYCRMGKAAVSSAGRAVHGFLGAKVIECDRVKGGKAIRQAVKEAGGGRTVPSVWVGGEFAGGGTDMSRLEKEGVLKQMIRIAVDHAKEKQQAEEENVQVNRMVGGAAEMGGNEVVMFGAGCFWGVELAFQRAPGVVSTQVGYAGGESTNTNYEEVCTGNTGHAEVVKVTYDPKVISFEDLLDIWEGRHDPTSLNKQGNDRGTQYRSALFYHSEDQKEKAIKWRDARTQKGKKIVTQIAPIKNYVQAEEYHQRYLEKRGQDASKGATATIRCYG